MFPDLQQVFLLQNQVPCTQQKIQVHCATTTQNKQFSLKNRLQNEVLGQAPVKMGFLTKVLIDLEIMFKGWLVL